MHKYASDLVPGDRFSMAGTHFRISDIYETNDPEMMRIAFYKLVTSDGDRRCTMTVPKRLLFILI